MSIDKKKILKKAKNLATKAAAGAVRSAGVRASRKKDASHVKEARRVFGKPGSRVSVRKTFVLGGKKKARQKKKIKKWEAEKAARGNEEQKKFLEMDKKNK